jgi:hypothetical protein
MRLGSRCHACWATTRAFLGAWLLLALLAQLGLSLQVPVSDRDLRDASWIVPYSTVMLPTRFQTVLAGLGASLLLIAAVLWRRQRANAVFVCLIGTSLLVAPSPAHMLRMGVASGTARVGCYVYAMRECREMLGLAVGDTRSRYPVRGVEPAGDYAGWYRLSFALLHPRRPELADLVSTLPGGYFMLGPRHAFDAQSINHALSSQREELERQRRQQIQDVPALSATP